MIGITLAKSAKGSIFKQFFFASANFPIPHIALNFPLGKSSD